MTHNMHSDDSYNSYDSPACDQNCHRSTFCSRPSTPQPLEWSFSYELLETLLLRYKGGQS